MDRLLLAAAVLALATASCGPDFKERRTPSGDFCSDMPIIPAGQEPDREYHRLQPIQSDVEKAHTEAERLESLRKAACKVGADAVIEAVNEEVRGANAQYNMVSSGTAVLWLRRASGETKPLQIGVKKAAVVEPPPEPPPAPTAEPSAVPSAKPAAGKGPKSGTKADSTKKSQQ